MRQEIMGFWDGSGISWTICKQSAYWSTPTPYQSIFYRPHALPDAQPTESKYWRHYWTLSIIHYPLYSSCQLFDKRGYRLLRLCWRELLMGWSYNRKLSLQSASERIWVVPCIHIGFGDSLSAAGLLECIPCCHISDKNYRHFQKSKGICLDYGAHCD